MKNDQLIRYSRNIILPEIGEEGQKKLLAAKVLVVGAGGLGSPVLLYLAAAGVGTIGIIDDDRVELGNLQRQILHETADINQPKAESARDAIHDLNPDIKIEIFNKRLTAGNIKGIIRNYDIIADGSDNFETRFLLNDECFTAKKTLVSAAIHRFEGQLSVFKAYLGEKHPCYRCIYPEMPPPGTMPKCSEAGILGSVAGIMGAWQATEILKEITGAGESLSGWLIIFDALKSVSRKVKVKKNRECPVCCTAN